MGNRDQASSLSGGKILVPLHYCCCFSFLFPEILFLTHSFQGHANHSYECVLEVVVVEMLPMGHYFYRKGSKFLFFLYFSFCLFLMPIIRMQVHWRTKKTSIYFKMNIVRVNPAAKYQGLLSCSEMLLNLSSLITTSTLQSF